jgi:hypothetical protein
MFLLFVYKIYPRDEPQYYKIQKEILPIHRYLHISQKYGHSDHMWINFVILATFLTQKRFISRKIVKISASLLAVKM